MGIIYQVPVETPDLFGTGARLNLHQAKAARSWGARCLSIEAAGGCAGGSALLTWRSSHMVCGLHLDVCWTWSAFHTIETCKKILKLACYNEVKQFQEMHYEQFPYTRFHLVSKSSSGVCFVLQIPEQAVALLVNFNGILPWTERKCNLFVSDREWLI